MGIVQGQAVTGEGVEEIGYFPPQAAKHQVGALESDLEMAEISASYCGSS